jgi:hypothetical protein
VNVSRATKPTSIRGQGQGMAFISIYWYWMCRDKDGSVATGA